MQLSSVLSYYVRILAEVSTEFLNHLSYVTARAKSLSSLLEKFFEIIYPENIVFR